MIGALIPVKELDAGKSRLEPSVGRPAARRLILAMLEDVIDALRAVPRVERVEVVTPDPAVAEAARRAGAHARVRPDPGLNASLDAATRELTEAGAEASLVVLADVAGARSRELTALLEARDALGSPCVVLAPSEDGGTSALLRAPADAIPCAFGPESAERHREAAKQAGVAVRELKLPSLRLDLDTEADLRAFLAGPGAGPRTRAALAELGIAGGA